MLNRLLLDSHVLLWSLLEPEKIGILTQQHILNSRVTYVSAATAWEIVLKERAGKLHLPEPISRGISRSGFVELPVTMDHVEMTAQIELPHKDPFDFLLLAQAITEDLILVTADRHLLAHPQTVNAKL